MKRILALALCLCFLLGGCAPGKAAAQNTEDAAPVAPSFEPTHDPAPAETAPLSAGTGYEALALALAALPELPAEPDEQAFNDAMAQLDWEKLGAEGYQAASEKLYQDYIAQKNAYADAMNALRGEGVDAALIPALARYTLRTARQLADGETQRNVVYSPANLCLALCMLAETTDGNTRAQLLDLLGLASVEQARAAANALWRSLYRAGAEDKTLLANSVWLNERMGYHADTVDTLATDYYASVFRAPMGDKATDAAVHAWINENTSHLLENAANALETDADTLMLLISALYFKGTWSKAFDDYSTREDVFTTADGTEQRIDFMHSAGNGTYYRGEGFTAAALPFRSGTTMWFLLPDEGMSVQSLLPDADNVSLCIDAPAGTVQNTAFGPLMAREGYAEIHWSVPKFDVSSDLDLIPALRSLGVTDVFDADAADFSPLTGLDAVVSAVEHAARVKVDETGCEAAAFTAVTVMPTSALVEPLPVVEMDLDRPFGFLITGAQGLPLFAGLVNTVA